MPRPRADVRSALLLLPTCSCSLAPPSAAMPHGDPSDYAAYTHLALGLATIFKPDLWFAAIGPLKPLLDGEATVAALAAARFAGGPLMFMAFTLFVVRWNTINGKAGAIGCFVSWIRSSAPRGGDPVSALGHWLRELKCCARPRGRA
jgi:hypothetical protein